jgi:nucleotide-binding universal stress UspA family protein
MNARSSAGWRHLIVTTDLSAGSERAFEAAAVLARHDSVRVTVLNVIDLRALGDSRALRDSLLRLELEERTKGAPRLEALCEKTFKDVPFEIAIVEGMGVAETICRHAREHAAELIVIASHGRTGARRFILGSVAERVMQLAPCDVLVVRSDAEAEESNPCRTPTPSE